MARSFTITFNIFILYNKCLSNTSSIYDSEPQNSVENDFQDYTLGDDYGYTDVQWLRSAGNYDEDEEWKVYGEPSGSRYELILFELFRIFL